MTVELISVVKFIKTYKNFGNIVSIKRIKNKVFMIALGVIASVRKQ
jgi:hypothetical protein